MPILVSFPANSAKQIEEHFQNNKISSTCYAYVAQPNDPDAQPFCFLFFGTGKGCMTYENVKKRWKHLTTELAKEHVEILGFSADGDCAVLRAMRIHAGLGTKFASDTKEYDDMTWFHAKFLPKQICLQDTVHLINKLKCRLLKLSALYPMGDYFCSEGDIRSLTKYTTKDKHQLNENDLNLKDKMNFGSSLKLSNPRILKLLKNTFLAVVQLKYI